MTDEPDESRENSWFGPFYFNRNDHRILVSKRLGIGWTFNFASPWSWVFMIIIIGVIIYANWNFWSNTKK